MRAFRSSVSSGASSLRSVPPVVSLTTADAYTFSIPPHYLRGQNTVVHHGFDFSDNYLRILRPLVTECHRTEHYSGQPNCTGFQHSLSILTRCPFNLSLSDLRCRVQQQIFHIPPRSPGAPSPRTMESSTIPCYSVLPGLFVFITSFFPFGSSKLAFSAAPGSLVSALIGVVAGQLYRADFFNLKRYQLPRWLIHLSSNVAPYVIGSTRPPRRTNRALYEGSRASVPRASGATDEGEGPITTALRDPPSTTRSSGGGRGDNSRSGTTTSVMRDWVNELTGRDGSSGVRIPSEAEISQVTAMFPNVGRETVVGALQRRYVRGFHFSPAVPCFTPRRTPTRPSGSCFASHPPTSLLFFFFFFRDFVMF